jgi:segregation and condensation protein A
LAAHLAFQLERLQAMREAAARLMGRDQLWRDFFARGLPEDVTKRIKITYASTLLDLMRAYARIRTKDEFRPYAFDRQNVYTMEQALDRMRGLLGYVGEWSDLNSFLPEGWDASPARRRSATAAHFAAVLELAKRGQVQIRQGEIFAPLMIRRTEAP